jgi:hypothetical protein
MWDNSKITVNYTSETSELVDQMIATKSNTSNVVKGYNISNIISFTIAGTTYQAEEGMTWEEWVGSSFNTDNKAKLHGQNVVHSCYFVASGTTNVAKTDVIVANRNYKKTNTAIC